MGRSLLSLLCEMFHNTIVYNRKYCRLGDMAPCPLNPPMVEKELLNVKQVLNLTNNRAISKQIQHLLPEKQRERFQ